MSSFDDFYKQWKEKNGVTTETAYQNLTDEQKAQKAVEGVDKTIERLRASRNNTSTNSIWNQIQNTKNTMNFNLSKNKQDELQQKMLQFKNQGATVNKNGKDITKREINNKLKLPEVQVANKKYEEQKQNKQIESIDKLISDYKAQEKAGEINKNIEKGGADAVNAVIENTLTNFQEGALGMTGGIINAPLVVGAGAIKATNKLVGSDKLDKVSNNILDKTDRIAGKYELNTKANQYVGNEGVQKLGGISNTIGGMLPSILANLFAPGSGVVVQGLGVGGKTAQDSINADRSNLGQSIFKGVGYGIASGEIEKLTGGNIFGKGSLDDFATKFIGNKISNKLGQKMASKAYEFLGEQLEEFLENQVDHVIDYIIEGKGITKEEWLSEFNETNQNTFLTTLVLNLLGLGGNTYNEIQNNSKIDNNTKTAIKEMNDVINKNDFGGEKQLEQFINDKLDNIDNTSSLQQESTQTQQIAPIQQINQEQNNTAQNENMEQINSFNGYTDNEINKLKSDKISIAKSSDDIVSFANNSKTFPGNFKMYVGKIKENVAKVINEKLGFNIDNYNISLKTDAIRHVLNEHSNSNENQRGQVPITAEDFKNIPEIINNPDNISDSGKTKQGKPVIKFEKNINGNNVAITYVSDKHKNLELQTMYKFKNDKKIDSVTMSNVINTLDRTSETNSDTNLINNIIPQTDKNMQVQQQEKVVTRHDVIQNNRQIARDNIKNISTWKDKSKGISYQLETMERNMYDIIPDKSEAKRINDTYFEPIHKSEAEKQKFINGYNNKIKEFDLNKYESEAVQLLGEQKYNPDFKAEDLQDILDKVNDNIEKGKVDEQKVNEAIETFRNIYDELFELENKALKENGYKEKPYRKGYFPHFIDYVPETRTEKVLNKLGFKIDKRPLPTDIAGITEQFVPGKTWNKSALERKGNKTDYNALKGFDTYIIQASDNIFHTDNIQRLRGLENEIRYQYSDKGVQERIDNILSDETLYEDEKQQLLDQILDQVNNPMPNLVTELRRYTNALANKKSEADRSVENKMGRPIYSTVNAIENRFGANAVGLNIGSALTNFIPITQAYSQVSTKNMGRAMIDTVKSYANNDNFVENSTFLTNRVNQAEKLYKTSLEKISDKSSILFNAIDEVTSNIVVRGKYLENIENGMNQTEAMEDADAFARKVIGDRSKGSLPTIFEEKNPITKIFTQFQLEVNNQYRYILKDIPRDLKEKGVGAIALAFFKMFAGAWLYNELTEKIIGRKPAFSPIDIAISSYKTITDKEQTTAEKVLNIGTDITQDIPFIGGLVGGGRVPVNGAIPNATNLIKSGIGLATGEMDRKKALNTIGKEVSKPLYYLLPPFGGGQIKKSVEGIQTVVKGGSYGVDSKGQQTLQFPVENANAGDYIKASLFGKYALPLAKDYTESGYKSLNAKDTKGYQDTKIPYKEFITYTNSNLKKKEEKIKFIEGMNISDKQKWEMYCYDIFESTEREKDKGSQLEDAKYAIANGTTKSEYIELYNNTNNRNMSMPTKEELAELKANGIELKNYMDFSIKVHDETKKQKANGNIKENAQLKNKDKISILLDGKYSEKEKLSIYSNYINKEDKKIELVNKLDFPLEEFLKYKQQEFKNDKDENEETISGTKKQKVVNYLNSIYDVDLSPEYKQIICKIENISSFDKEVANFVTNYPGLTVEEQKELLEIIGFDVDKNGKIKTTTMLPIKKYVK